MRVGVRSGYLTLVCQFSRRRAKFAESSPAWAVTEGLLGEWQVRQPSHIHPVPSQQAFERKYIAKSEGAAGARDGLGGNPNSR